MTVVSTSYSVPVTRVSAYISCFPILDIARFSGHISVSRSQMTAFKTAFIVLTLMGGVWLTAIGAVLYAVNAFQDGGAGRSVADGSILMTVLALALIINVAIVAPGLLMLQPFRLWWVVRDERRAITPRERFRGGSSRSFCEPCFMYCVCLPPHLLFGLPFGRLWGACCVQVDPCSNQQFSLFFFIAVYPGVYDPVYAMSCCILAIIFASAFALILPLIAPAVTLLLFLTLIGRLLADQIPNFNFVAS